jgi:rhodanese-related sulfurtransferase
MVAVTSSTTDSAGPSNTSASADAIDFFERRLRFQTDVSDVHAALDAGDEDFVLVDSRGETSWLQGHIPGAIHLPTREIAERARVVVPVGSKVVTYCWGPGCDGATRAALEFARLGYPVQEMIGGFEYWVREGFPARTDKGDERAPVDALTAPTAGFSCDC